MKIKDIIQEARSPEEFMSQLRSTAPDIKQVYQKYLKSPHYRPFRTSDDDTREYQIWTDNFAQFLRKEFGHMPQDLAFEIGNHLYDYIKMRNREDPEGVAENRTISRPNDPSIAIKRFTAYVQRNIEDLASMVEFTLQQKDEPYIDDKFVNYLIKADGTPVTPVFNGGGDVELLGPQKNYLNIPVLKFAYYRGFMYGGDLINQIREQLGYKTKGVAEARSPEEFVRQMDAIAATPQTFEVGDWVTIDPNETSGYASSGMIGRIVELYDDEGESMAKIAVGGGSGVQTKMKTRGGVFGPPGTTIGLGKGVRSSGTHTVVPTSILQKYDPQGVAEAGPFSYGKPPRKGSVADLAAKKRREQERGKQPIEPKDQMVGVAKVTKGVAEGSKEKTPGIALSKAYKKDFDDKKPGQDRKETALTGTYSKTGKPGGELKKQGVAEGIFDFTKQPMPEHGDELKIGDRYVIFDDGGSHYGVSWIKQDRSEAYEEFNKSEYTNLNQLKKAIWDEIKYQDQRGVAEDKKPDRYHIVGKDGKPADLASYPDRASAEQVRDKKYPDAVVQQVGPRGKVKGVTEQAQICSECGGPSYSNPMLAEKKDACYHKVKSRVKVWPSAYASGQLVQCRKRGASNWGTGGKKK